MSTRSQNPTVIVTGMHCSGTRMVAAMLAALSVRMGDHLRTAEARREAGRFEDEKFVRFHRRVLAGAFGEDAEGYPDWGWSESEQFDPSCFNRFRDEAKRLLATRAHESEVSGWEDPRATLFLDQWDDLIEDARYVLVYGFPWDVSEAMQWLWIEKFITHPQYAYRIWNYYNQRVRDFYVKHADRCLLVNFDALSKNVERFVFLLGKLGIGSTDLGLAEVVESHAPKSIDEQESWIESAVVGNLRSRWLDYDLKTRWINVQRQDPLVDLAVMAWPDSANLLSEMDGLADISGDELWQSRPVKSRLLRPDASLESPVDVSIITPCYNQGTLLIDAIASVERHAPANSELIIINDGSQDQWTLEILARLKGAGYFVFDQENAGLSAARDRGFSLARGRYVLPLDDDNRIRKGYIEEAIRVLDSDPEVGVVYGDRQDFGWYHKTQSVPEFDLFSLLKRNFIDACAVLRKQVWVDCNGYDTDLTALEDWELWIHAAELGWKFHHLPFVAFDYRVRPGSMVSVFNSAEIWEDFCRRIRDKHPQFYWNVAVGRIEALKSEIQSLTWAADGQGSEALQTRSGTEAAVNDREIEQLIGKLNAVSAQLAEREAELSRMRGSFGWRLLDRYGQIKYRYLLPVYRLFGRAPAAFKESTPASKT